MQIKVPVAELEFTEGHHTIWVHSPQGATVLRIKCTGKISVQRGCVNSVAHADVWVDGDIEFCVPKESVPHVH